MTNFEKVKSMNIDEMANFLQDIGNYCENYCTEGEKCTENCVRGIRGWLKESVKPTLSEVERVILENIDKDYKWIARDEAFNVLYVYEDKPIKNANNNWGNDKNNTSLEIYNHLFQFITWRDDEPYNIEELLKN